MVWIHAITEVDSVVMNPISTEKFLSLARQLRIRSDSRVLDIGAGRCGPALLLARDFGCRVTAVEPFADFLDEGRIRVESAGLTHLFQFVEKKGRNLRSRMNRTTWPCVSARLGHGTGWAARLMR